jgi:hypothetical protein
MSNVGRAARARMFLGPDECARIAVPLRAVLLSARRRPRQRGRDTDAAFSWLDRCLDERDSRLFWLRIRPFFDELRGDARFDELLSRVNHAAGGALP